MLNLIAKQTAAVRWMKAGGIIFGVGVVLFFVSGALTTASAVASTSDSSSGLIFIILSLLLITVGFFTFAGSLIYAVLTANSDPSTSPRETIRRVYIISKRAVNPGGYQLMSDDILTPEDKCYLRVQLPGGVKTEMRCGIELFDHIAEHTTVNIDHQADWVVSYEMVPENERVKPL